MLRPRRAQRRGASWRGSPSAPRLLVPEVQNGEASTKPRWLMLQREKVYLALNLLLLTFCSIGIAQFAAFFPLYVGELGIRQELVAPIFSVFMASSLVMSMASGLLANRYGRLQVLTAAVGCVSVGSILFGLTPGLVAGEQNLVLLFIVARLIQGVGRAGASLLAP